MSLRPLVTRLATILGLRVLPEWVVDATMALLLARIWVDPFWIGPSVPEDLLAIGAFEGIAIHATPLWILARSGKIPSWMLLVYLPFALGAAFVLDSFWLAAIFLWHLAAAGWHEEASEEETALRFTRYVGVVLILVLTMVVVWLVPVPELGWTAEVIPAELAWEKGSGALVYPGLPAALTGYFTLRSLWYLWWRYMAATGQLTPRER